MTPACPDPLRIPPPAPGLACRYITSGELDNCPDISSAAESTSSKFSIGELQFLDWLHQTLHQQLQMNHLCYKPGNEEFQLQHLPDIHQPLWIREEGSCHYTICVWKQNAKEESHHIQTGSYPALRKNEVAIPAKKNLTFPITPLKRDSLTTMIEIKEEEKLKTEMCFWSLIRPRLTPGSSTSWPIIVRSSIFGY